MHFVYDDRFAATLYPLSSLNRWLKINSNLVLAIGWVLAAALGIYPLIYTKVISFAYKDKDYYDCILQDDSSMNTRIYTVINFLSTFFIPTIIMIGTYGTIGEKLLYYHSAQQTVHQINKIKVRFTYLVDLILVSLGLVTKTELLNKINTWDILINFKVKFYN